MNKNIIFNLYKKEMLDVIRDKKTIIVMIVVPLILYPLLFVAGIGFITGITKNISESTYIIAFEDPVDDELADLFSTDENNSYSFKIFNVDNCSRALAEEDIDAYISINNNKEYVIHYLSSVNNSTYAADYSKEILEKYARNLTIALLEDNELNSKEILNPIEISYKDMAGHEESAGNLLGTILPYMLIISILMGTVYPAIDITAGERERGTLETMLTLPITNRQLIISKFLTVATLGIITALLNVISMGFVCGYMLNIIEMSGVDMDVCMTRFVPAILIGILCIVAFAVFMSAITMCVTSFAKTYKEANNYITPLALVVMFASFAAFIPGIELKSGVALVPVANICLLIKNILVFKFDIGIITLVLVSNVLYAIVAVIILGRIYNCEAVLFGDGSGSIQIFEKRSNIIPGGLPSLEETMLVLAVAAVAVIYFGGMAQLKYGILGIAITQLIIVGIPFGVSVYTKKDLIKTFRLRFCKPAQILASVIIIFGAMAVGMIVTAISGRIFRESAQNVDESALALMGDTFPVTLLVVAVLPAVCEEMMFRGFVLTSMEKRFKAVWAVLISGALFGIYHMSIVKFFTTFLLGAVICYVARVTKSIVPGMIMHFINNAISVVYMYYPEKIERLFPFMGMENAGALDIITLAFGGTLLLLAGIIFLNRTSKN